MKRIFLSAFFLFVFIILGALTLSSQKKDQQGELEWNTLSQTFTLPAGITTHSASFHFKNISTQTITIQTIKPDCNCLVSQIARTTIPSGTGGEIETIFNPGDRSGIQKRTIEVRLKEFPDQVVNLQLVYHIPELVRISHRLLFWNEKEKPTGQEIELTMPDEKIKVIGVRSSNRDFTCEIIPVTEGREYKVRVTPLDLSSARQSVLLIDTDYPKAPWNRIVANVKIE